MMNRSRNDTLIHLFGVEIFLVAIVVPSQKASIHNRFAPSYPESKKWRRVFSRNFQSRTSLRSHPVHDATTGHQVSIPYHSH